MSQLENQNIDNLLAKHFSHEILSEEEQKQVFYWKEKNREMYLRLEQIMLSNKNDSEHLKVNTEKAWQKVITKRKTAKVRRLQNRIIKISVAASIALIIGITSWRFLTSSQKFKTYETAQQIEEVNLPDGSVVTLNKHAALQYNISETGERNVKLLKGEAFFNVTKDSLRPFKIYTNNLQIKVLGTSFNVNSTKTTTKVSVKTGLVSISHDDKNLTLRQGEQGLLKNKRLYKIRLNDDNYIAWKEKRLSFKKNSLRESIPLLESYFDIKIELDNFSDDCFFTTTFTTETLEEALQELQLILNCKYKIDDKNVILYDIKCQ